MGDGLVVVEAASRSACGSAPPFRRVSFGSSWLINRLKNEWQARTIGAMAKGIWVR
jgi:hypothetical protein